MSRHEDRPRGGQECRWAERWSERQGNRWKGRSLTAGVCPGEGKGGEGKTRNEFRPWPSQATRPDLASGPCSALKGSKARRPQFRFSGALGDTAPSKSDGEGCECDDGQPDEEAVTVDDHHTPLRASSRRPFHRCKQRADLISSSLYAGWIHLHEGRSGGRQGMIRLSSIKTGPRLISSRWCLSSSCSHQAICSSLKGLRHASTTSTRTRTGIAFRDVIGKFAYNIRDSLLVPTECDISYSVPPSARRSR